MSKKNIVIKERNTEIPYDILIKFLSEDYLKTAKQ